MKYLDLLNKKGVFTVAIFVAIFIGLFYKLGTYPEFFTPITEHTIYPAVEKVLDNKDLSDEVTWQWTDMHQHGAYRSPIYIAAAVAGMSVYGFNLFGIRVVGTVVTFCALIVFYCAVEEYFSRRLALIFLILLASSPWFLVFQRSGGIFSISLSLVLLGLSIVMLLLKSEKALSLLAFTGGLAVALFPYGYAIIRAIAILLILWVVLGYFLKESKYKLKHLLLFLFPIVTAIIIQIGFFQTNIALFFHARGESMATAMAGHEYGAGVNEMVSKVIQNAIQNVKILSGDYLHNAFGKWVIVQNYWESNIIVYPKFLVPFFFIGAMLLVVIIIKRRSLDPLLFLLLLLFGLAPGLLSRIGGPNPARNYIAIIPVYFCIAYTVERIFFDNKIFLNNYPKLRTCLAGIGVFVVVGTVIYQFHNYFYYEREVEQHSVLGIQSSLDFVFSHTSDSSETRVLYYGGDIFGVHSNTLVRYLGEDKFQKLYDNGKVSLIDHNNINESFGNLEDFDVLVSSSIDNENLNRAELMKYRPIKFGHATVYHLR